MATAYIRLHEATSHEGEKFTVLGTSRSLIGLFDHPIFMQFLEGIGADYRKTPPDGLAPRGGTSTDYLEIQPPLNDDQIRELGVLCVGGNRDGKVVQGIEEGYMIDNRVNVPGRYFPDDIIAPRYAGSWSPSVVTTL